ncbi:MAG: TIGR02996 domain-containing protein [Gemmataceae bacterium]|nr:TIGR02996 domain-containing protein [Gemmataceae bacterium]
MPMHLPTLAHPSTFLNDILEDPQNDEPRLRYAAWLDDQGDPLGEFIHVQCRLASAPDSGIAWEWERREQELLAEHEDDWAADVRGLVEWWTFRRGFIEEIAVAAGRFLQYADRLFDQAPILVVHLSRSREHVEALAECHWLLRLRHLDLSNNFVRDPGVKLLTQSAFLSELHSLNLSSAAVGDSGVRALACSPFLKNLRELYLSDNRISAAGVRDLASSRLADQLDLLHLRFNPIDGDGAALLHDVFGDRARW